MNTNSNNFTKSKGISWNDPIKLAQAISDRNANFCIKTDSIRIASGAGCNNSPHIGSLRELSITLFICNILKYITKKPIEHFFIGDDFDPFRIKKSDHSERQIGSYVFDEKGKDELQLCYFMDKTNTISLSEAFLIEWKKLYGKMYIENGIKTTIAKESEMYLSGKYNDTLKRIYDNEKILLDKYKNGFGNLNENFRLFYAVRNNCVLYQNKNNLPRLVGNYQISYTDNDGKEHTTSIFNGLSKVSFRLFFLERKLPNQITFESGGQDSYTMYDFYFKNIHRILHPTINEENMYISNTYGILLNPKLGNKKVSKSKDTEGILNNIDNFEKYLTNEVLIWVTLDRPYIAQIILDEKYIEQEINLILTIMYNLSEAPSIYTRMQFRSIFFTLKEGKKMISKLNVNIKYRHIENTILSVPIFLLKSNKVTPVMICKLISKHLDNEIIPNQWLIKYIQARINNTLDQYDQDDITRAVKFGFNLHSLVKSRLQHNEKDRKIKLINEYIDSLPFESRKMKFQHFYSQLFLRKSGTSIHDLVEMEIF